VIENLIENLTRRQSLLDRVKELKKDIERYSKLLMESEAQKAIYKELIKRSHINVAPVILPPTFVSNSLVPFSFGNAHGSTQSSSFQFEQYTSVNLNDSYAFGSSALWILMDAIGAGLAISVLVSSFTFSTTGILRVFSLTVVSGLFISRCVMRLTNSINFEQHHFRALYSRFRSGIANRILSSSSSSANHTFITGPKSSKRVSKNTGRIINIIRIVLTGFRF
jgi:hypothetical protein